MKNLVQETIKNMIEAYQNLDYKAMVNLFKSIPENNRHEVNEFIDERYSDYFKRRFSDVLMRHVSNRCLNK